MIRFQASQIIKERISGLKLGLLQAGGVTIRPSGEPFDQAIEKLRNQLRQKFAEIAPSEDTIVGHVRRMYRRIGWEPTKYRPSSEKLIRRLLKNQSLYRINNFVDYGNLASASFHLPMGLYDSEAIEGQPVMDVGGLDESYTSIAGNNSRATGKMILRDAVGIFGNPTADSARTALTEQSCNILAVFFCPPEVSEDYLKQTLETLERYYRNFCKEKPATHIQVIS